MPAGMSHGGFSDALLFILGEVIWYVIDADVKMLPHKHLKDETWSREKVTSLYYW